MNIVATKAEPLQFLEMNMYDFREMGKISGIFVPA